ncbi:MAG: MmgE/PrpD family protein [Alphaproteobacteria bacterium]|nr:MmgE/PrpD family protein [Alphaproteobacteria bacterium]
MTALARRLARLIQAKPITEADYEAAALFTLDAVANAVAGVNSEPGGKLLAAQAAGTPIGRAFVIGALTHIHETDDLHRASVVHPGCVVVPAAWALAERRGASGRETLRAVLWGFEAACRVGASVGPAHYKVWHNTATCGPFGGAAAGAALLGLSEDQFAWALGNAGTQASGLWEFMASSAMSKHLHAGRAAEAGQVAAELAAQDFTGPETILEGEKGFYRGLCTDPRPDAVTETPDAPWALVLTSIKPWPCCRHTHPAIDAALELHGKIAGRPIAEVKVEAYRAALDVCDRVRPETEYQAKFSLQHCVAVALREGKVDFASFGPEARARQAELRPRVSLAVADPFASAYPVNWGSAVEITLADGTLLRAARRDAKGDPEAPLSRADMIAKADMLMKLGGLGDPRPLIEAVLAMAQEGSTLPALLLGRVR